METKDILALIAIGMTFFAAAWNLIYTLSVTKKTRFINIVTSARIQWIQKLRKDVSRYAGLARHWSITPIDPADARKIQEESDVLRLQIRLQLNPKDNADLIGLLDEIAKHTDSHPDEVKALIESLVRGTQHLLKSEWARVKREANGDITYENVSPS